VNFSIGTAVSRWRCGRHLVRALAVFLLFSALFPASAHCGAWTQDAGHGQIIVTSSLFRTSTAFDQSGNRQLFSDDGRFRQSTLSSYFEYGLTSRNTFILNTTAPFLDFTNQYGKQTSAGLGDMEVSLKRRLNPVESPWAFSGQLTVMFPAYSATRNPAPGNHQEDVEVRFMAGRGATVAKRHLFWDAEVAYRYRSGAPADQVRSDGTVGMDLTRRLMVMGQFFAIKGLRNGEPLTANSNPNAQSDFDLYKYQPSVVLTLGHGSRLQFGWNNAFSGRNTGRGPATILALWKTF